MTYVIKPSAFIKCLFMHAFGDKKKKTNKTKLLCDILSSKSTNQSALFHKLEFGVMDCSNNGRNLL